MFIVVFGVHTIQIPYKHWAFAKTVKATDFDSVIVGSSPTSPVIAYAI